MPFRLFNKSEPDLKIVPQPAAPGPETLREGPLFAGWYLQYRLGEEMERARRYGRPLAVAIADAPALLPGERLSAEALAAATEAAQIAARSTDLLGWLDGYSFLMIMPETTDVDAEAALSRWRSEMWLRSRSFGGQKWNIAILPSPVEFDSAEQLIESIPELLTQREAA